MAIRSGSQGDYRSLRNRIVTMTASIKVEATFMRRERILIIGLSLLSGFGWERGPGALPRAFPSEAPCGFAGNLPPPSTETGTHSGSALIAPFLSRQNS